MPTLAANCQQRQASHLFIMSSLVAAVSRLKIHYHHQRHQWLENALSKTK
jgi:hypothetical protein